MRLLQTMSKPLSSTSKNRHPLFKQFNLIPIRIWRSLISYMSQPDKLTPTQERFTYEAGEIEIEHYHRYQLALSLVEGNRVLDIASGEGYGSNLLASVASSVVGVDIDQECVDYANARYGSCSLEYRQGDAASIPVEDGSVDVVVSFETIEHHDRHQEMMDEVRRVLVPEGILMLSSPDKKYYSDVPNFQNTYHVKELYFEEFKELVAQHFKHSRYYLQRMVKGSLIFPEDNKFEKLTVFEKEPGDALLVGRREFAQHYEICVASDSEQLPSLEVGLFDGKQVLHEEIQKLLQIETAKFENVINSPTWRIGNAILAPFKWLRSLLNK